MTKLVHEAAPSAAFDAPPLVLQVQEQRSDPALNLLWYRPLALETVHDVTGAGDNLLAGTARAFCAGWSLERAVVAGLLAAHIALHVDGGVPPFLSAELWRRESNVLLEAPASSRL